MDNTTLKQHIIDYLFKFGEVCGGECGKNPYEIATDLKIDYELTKTLIKELHNEKKIRAKNTPFGVLLFLNYNKL